jgi:hypothetical protein
LDRIRLAGSRVESPPKQAFESGGSNRKAGLSPSKARGCGLFRRSGAGTGLSGHFGGGKPLRFGSSLAVLPAPWGWRRGTPVKGPGFSFAAGNRCRRFAVLVTGDCENDRSTIILIRRAIVVFVFRQMISFSNAKSLHAAFDETPLI